MIKRDNIIDPNLLNHLSDSVECLVIYRGDENSFKQQLQKIGAEIIEGFPYMNAISVRLTRRDIRRLGNIGNVESVLTDMHIKTLMNIASEVLGVKDVINRGYTGKGIGIAFIDTGLYPHHDFTRPINRVKAFVDLTGKNESMYDDNGHGTFCAGVAAGNGFCSKGVYRGCAPEANIIAVKAMDKDGGGDLTSVLRALQWVHDNARKYNIRIVSMSVGTTPSSNSKIDPLELGVAKLWERGIVVVAAAGNSGPARGTITTPGICRNIITVGALDDGRGEGRAIKIPEFSSRGPAAGGIIKPDMLAPGVNIISVKSDIKYTSGPVRIMEPYTSMSGTSVAAPMVAGICALLLQRNPRLHPNEVKKLLMSCTIPLTGNVFDEGGGRLFVR